MPAESRPSHTPVKLHPEQKLLALLAALFVGASETVELARKRTDRTVTAHHIAKQAECIVRKAISECSQQEAQQRLEPINT